MMTVSAEIETLEANLASLNLKLEQKIDWLGTQSGTREARYKEIVLQEMRKMVRRLREIDEQVSRELKSDAECLLTEISKIEDEISNAVATLSTTNDPSKKGVIKELIMKLKTKVAIIEKSFPTDALDLSVAENSGHLLQLTSNLIDSIYIGSSKILGSDKGNGDLVLTSQDGSKSNLKNFKSCCSPEKISLESSMWELDSDTPILQKGQFLSTWMVDCVSRSGLNQSQQNYRSKSKTLV